MSVQVAVVQQDGNPGQVDVNRDKALGFAREALREGADIIVFPEEMLIGYVENLRELAEPVNGPTTLAFAKLLAGSSTLVLYGLTERDDDRFYIAATLVGAGGVVANYRKTHLWWKASGLRHEPTFYTPGEHLVTFDLGGYKAGIMICYDGDFPEMTRAYANRGCEMLVWPNNRGDRGHAEVKPLAVANSMIIAASCVNGPDETGEICRGGSNITSYDGTLLAEIWDAEGVIYAEVHPEEVAEHRRQNPSISGRRPELYG